MLRTTKQLVIFFRIFLQTLVGRVIERLKWGSETSLRRFVVKRPKRQQNYNGQEAGGAGRPKKSAQLSPRLGFCQETSVSKGLSKTQRPWSFQCMQFIQIYANRFPRLKPTEFWACYMFVVAAPFWLSWPCFFFPPSLPTSSASRWESLCVEWRCHFFLFTLTCDDDASKCFFRSG